MPGKIDVQIRIYAPPHEPKWASPQGMDIPIQTATYDNMIINLFFHFLLCMSRVTTKQT
jgi:hypothetical protein